jgi:hypothetical protein
MTAVLCDLVLFYGTLSINSSNWITAITCRRVLFALFILTIPIGGCRVTYLGVSPRYLSTLDKAGYSVKSRHNVGSLKVISVTGAPITNDVYDYLEKHVKRLFLVS